jgi:type II secretory pathway component PulF
MVVSTRRTADVTVATTTAIARVTQWHCTNFRTPILPHLSAFHRPDQELPVLTEQVHAFVDQFAKALELLGLAIILGGIILATVALVARRCGHHLNNHRAAHV